MRFKRIICHTPVNNDLTEINGMTESAPLFFLKGRGQNSLRLNRGARRRLESLSIASGSPPSRMEEPRATEQSLGRWPTEKPQGQRMRDASTGKDFVRQRIP